MKWVGRGRCGRWSLCATWDQAMLVLEDAGGEPLDRLTRRAHGDGTLLAPGHRYCQGSGQVPPARPRPQGHQAGQHPGERRDRRGAAHWVRHRLAASPRATGARAARVHRRHARLHGAGTDRTDESLDRFAQRPLFARRHTLSVAHGHASFHCVRSHGVGPLPYREEACAAGRADQARSPSRSLSLS